MQNFIKKHISLLLTLFLLLSTTFFILITIPNSNILSTASALEIDESTTPKLTDGKFKFESSATYKTNLDDTQKYIQFDLSCLDSALRTYASNDNYFKNLWWGSVGDGFYAVRFDVYSVNVNNQRTLQKTYIAMFGSTALEPTHLDLNIFVRDYAGMQISAYVDPGLGEFTYRDSNQDMRSRLKTVFGGVGDITYPAFEPDIDNFTLQKQMLIPREYANLFSVPGFIQIFIDNNYYTNYQVDFSYCLDYISYAGMFLTEHTQINGFVRSDIVSFNSLIQQSHATNNYDDDVTQEEIYEIEDIINAGYTKTVTIEYLVPFENTPFYVRERKTLDVVVRDDVLNSSDIFNALSVDEAKELTLEHANLMEFRLDNTRTAPAGSSGLYVAYYNCSVWIRNVTQDKTYVDYFFSINYSFYDVFYKYVDGVKLEGSTVEDGIIESEMYDYFYGEICMKYEDLKNSGIQPDELYGFFGIIVAPKSYSASEFYKEVLMGENTQKTGDFNMFSYTQNLTTEQYLTLCSDYDMGFMSTLWANAVNLFQNGQADANVFLIYSTADGDGFIAPEDVKEPDDLQGDGVIPPIIDNIASASEALKTPVIVVFACAVGLLALYIVSNGKKKK